MKRSIVLGIVGTLSLAVVAAQDTTKVIDVERLENNLFVLRGEGGGGNTAVFITTDGVVVVDTKNPGWGQPILEQIKALTSNPVTTLINTHSHGDHVSGNVAFADHGRVRGTRNHQGQHGGNEALHRADRAAGERVRGHERPRLADTDVHRPDVAR